MKVALIASILCGVALAAPKYVPPPPGVAPHEDMDLEIWTRDADVAPVAPHEDMDLEIWTRDEDVKVPPPHEDMVLGIWKRGADGEKPKEDINFGNWPKN